MSEVVEITVQNRFASEKRDLNVYHHASRSANLIGCGSTVTLPLRTASEGDYIHISVVQGPGKLQHECVVNLPAWVNFDFSAVGEGFIRHTGKRTLLTIPPGPPDWQLKITRSSDTAAVPQSDYITLGDSPQAEGE
jgi:hypothetical protein